MVSPILYPPILCKWLVQKNLAAFFRYPSFICCKQIKIAADGFQMKNLPGIVLSTHNIRRVAALSQFHTVNVRYRFLHHAASVPGFPGSSDPSALPLHNKHLRNISYPEKTPGSRKKNATPSATIRKIEIKRAFTFPDLHPEIFV